MASREAARVFVDEALQQAALEEGQAEGQAALPARDSFAWDQLDARSQLAEAPPMAQPAPDFSWEQLSPLSRFFLQPDPVSREREAGAPVLDTILGPMAVASTDCSDSAAPVPAPVVTLAVPEFADEAASEHEFDYAWTDWAARAPATLAVPEFADEAASEREVDIAEHFIES